MLLSHGTAPIKADLLLRNAKSRLLGRNEDCKFVRVSDYKPMPRVHSRLTGYFAVVAHAFGRLRSSEYGKVRALRTETANANAARAIAENARIAQRRQTKGNGPSATSNNSQTGDAQARLATAEAEAAKAQSEKAEALAKLQSTENQLAQLQKNIQVGGTNTAESGGSTVAELQAQLDEARRELDNAEREKVFVSEKTQGDRATPSAPRPTTQERVTRRHTSPPGLHGTILAVNQAYNFVVLNLGGRQGVADERGTSRHARRHPDRKNSRFIS